jgi:hypothetical protein
MRQTETGSLPLLDNSCNRIKAMMTRREIPTEVYSRVVGYFRPVHQWNNGKKEEFCDRAIYDPARLPQAVEYSEV